MPAMSAPAGAAPAVQLGWGTSTGLEASVHPAGTTATGKAGSRDPRASGRAKVEEVGWALLDAMESEIMVTLWNNRC